MKNIFCNSSNLKNEASVERLFVDRLLADLGYSDSDIAAKQSLKEIKVGRGSKSELYKPDYVLLNQKIPIVVLDAKAPNETISKWTLQCSSYCLELNKKYDYNPVSYYLISNGLATSLFQWDTEAPILTLDFSDFSKSNSKYKKLKSIVSKRSVARNIKQNRENLDQSRFVFKNVPLSNLLELFQKIHLYIWKKEKKKPSSVFEELMKLIFIKIQKDKDLHKDHGPELDLMKRDVVFSKHWIKGQTQSANPINNILFHNLIADLETEIKAKRKKRVFNVDDDINLASDTIEWVVEQLEHIDLFGMEEDIHGRMFESFLEATVRGKELGQFFTPRDVVRLMVELADIKVTKTTRARVLDACCGSGGFLIQALNAMITKAQNIPGLSNKEFESIRSEIQNESIFGIDAGSDPQIYKLARMNMYLHGDGGSNIFFADSLDKRIGTVGKMSVEYQQEIEEIRDLFKNGEMKFDVILSNPPFSLKYAADDSDQLEILEQYELFRITGKPASSLLSSVMFLERYKEFVSDTGRILAIIDESVLSGESYRKVRDWLRDTFIFEAIISLPGDSFKRCEARVKTSILILRLKKLDETQPSLYLNYAVRLGLEDSVAKRIGINIADLEEKKDAELSRIVAGFRDFKNGIGSANIYPASSISDRLDVKYCIKDKGRKVPIWISKGRRPETFKNVLMVPQNRKTTLSNEEEYQFLRVNYSGGVLEGDLKLGSDCSYRHLFQVDEWDILISNMGVGRGAVGLVPPYHKDKYVSNEYTILSAKSKEEAVYYSSLMRTKEILGDVLTTTTGMNRGRIDWDIISAVEVPRYTQKDAKMARLVKSLEAMWKSHEIFSNAKKTYMGAVSTELELDGIDAQERWLGFKPPE